MWDKEGKKEEKERKELADKKTDRQTGQTFK